MISVLRLSAALVVGVLPTLSCQARGETNARDARGTIELAQHHFKVEVAATPQSRAKGLMHRRKMEANEGMLFIFPRESVQHFWMRNTYLRLDMIFMNKEFEVVGIVENAEPLTETDRSVDKPSMYVLEILGGLSQKHGLKPGMKARYTAPKG